MRRLNSFCYTSHMGYRIANDPLFPESVAGSDPWDHVAFAAEHGFSGMFYPLATSRPEEEVERYEAAIQHFDMRSSCILFSDIEQLLQPNWVSPEGWGMNSAAFDRALALADRLDSNMLAILLRANPSESRTVQEKFAIDNLRHAGDAALKRGMTLGIEPMNAFPDMLLGTTEEAVALIREVDHPAVKIIFDIGFSYLMDEDVYQAYGIAAPYIGLLQLADMPGRTEIGSGSIDIHRILLEHMKSGYGGSMVDLEHNCSRRSIDLEASIIDTLHKIDSRLCAFEGN